MRTLSSEIFLEMIAAFEKVVGPFDFQRLHDKFGVTQQLLSDPFYRVNGACTFDLFTQAKSRSGTPEIALHIVDNYAVRRGPIVVRRLGMADTIYMYFQTNLPLSRMSSETFDLSINTVSDDASFFEFKPYSKKHVSTMQTEFALGLFSRVTRIIFSQFIKKHDKSILYFSFSHSCEAENISIYEEKLAFPVKFDQPVDGVYMANDWLNEKIGNVKVDFDKMLSDRLLKYALEKEDFYQHIYNIVSLLMPYFCPSISDVAKFLNISERTLQRRLKAEGFSFRALLDEVRRKFADDILTRKSHSISELAYLLGYSNITAFYKAYTRWYGRPPGSH